MSVRRNIKRSQEHEKRAMARLGGVRHGGSGAAWSRKADGRVNAGQWSDPGHRLVEMKRTDKDRFVLRLADVEKIIREAVSEGRSPLMSIQIQTLDLVLLPAGDLFTLGFEKVERVRLGTGNRQMTIQRKMLESHLTEKWEAGLPALFEVILDGSPYVILEEDDYLTALDVAG